MRAGESGTSALPVAGSAWTEPNSGMAFVWIDALQLWVGRYMVTNAEYRQFRPKHRSGDYDGHSLDGERQPVVSVSYDEAVAFGDWLTHTLHGRGALPAGGLVRLPAHDEWSTFARCGDGRRDPWGNDWPPRWGNYADESAGRAFPDWEVIAGYDDGYAVTCPVEDSGVNPWGLYGVGGNAYEWTFEADGTSPELRGGSWSTSAPRYMETMDRYRREPSGRLVNFGFRVLLVTRR
jgi:formylglycine-generating enzyme required for sulfatase activity